MVLTFFWIRCSLHERLILFFLFSVCYGCAHKPSEVALVWEGERAVGVSIPRQYFREIRDDSIQHLLQVHLFRATHQPAIAGNYDVSGGDVIFKPLIPFTRGLTYEVMIAGSDPVRITIPPVDKDDRPVISEVYPTQDTLPSNLLKMYLQFSRPMQTGQALKHILLIKNGGDTLPGVFLDLQPELWNYEGTMLTLWLDPGRIKRDLQPNLKMGAPLQQASRYTLVISADWSDTQGAALQEGYLKDFFVEQRDSLSPNPVNWTIATPAVGTNNPVIIDFNETLDYSVVMEAIHIKDAEGNLVAGNAALSDEESVYQFFPEGKWSGGSYFLLSEGRLEDVAGNNLNRPFDRDIQDNAAPPTKEVFSRTFQIN